MSLCEAYRSGRTIVEVIVPVCRVAAAAAVVLSVVPSFLHAILCVPVEVPVSVARKSRLTVALAAVTVGVFGNQSHSCRIGFIRATCQLLQL